MNRLLLLLAALMAGILTCRGQASPFDLVVAADGSGDFVTVQAAIDAAPDNSTSETIIFIHAGTYREKILVPASKTHLTLLGEDVDSTRIVWDDFSGRVVNGDTLGTSTSYTFRVDPDHFKAQNLTFENSAGQVGQAVAVLVNGDKNMFYHCKMVGDQDTYYTKGYGRIYNKDCYIEGTTDFIFGRSVAVFDSCLIISKKTSYITAASTEENYAFGYVFFDCQLGATSSVYNVSLGRPWRPFARTVFLRSYLDTHIAPSGWSEWNGNTNHTTCFYAEYACVGPRAPRTFRKAWTHELTEAEAADYTLANVFAQATAPTEYSDDWLPQLDSLPYSRFVSFPFPVSNASLREAVGLKVFPNPSDSAVSLSLDLPRAASCSFLLFDAAGRQVFQAPTRQLSPGPQEIALPLPKLPAGTYSYRLTADDQTTGGNLQLR